MGWMCLPPSPSMLRVPTTVDTARFWGRGGGGDLGGGGLVGALGTRGLVLADRGLWRRATLLLILARVLLAVVVVLGLR